MPSNRFRSACAGLPKEKCGFPCEMTKSLNAKYQHCRTKFLNVEKRVKKIKHPATRKRALKKLEKVEQKIKKAATEKNAETATGLLGSVTGMLSSVLPSSTEPEKKPEEVIPPSTEPEKKPEEVIPPSTEPEQKPEEVIPPSTEEIKKENPIKGGKNRRHRSNKRR